MKHLLSTLGPGNTLMIVAILGWLASVVLPSPF